MIDLQIETTRGGRGQAEPSLLKQEIYFGSWFYIQWKNGIHSIVVIQTKRIDLF